MPNISDSDLPGLAAPAQLALVAAGVQHLELSMKYSEIEGKQWHGIVQISTANRVDIGIKLKKVAPFGRFEPAGKCNNLVAHRVQISDPLKINSELLSELKHAYAAAQA